MKKILHFEKDILELRKRKPSFCLHGFLIYRLGPVLSRDFLDEKGFDIYIKGELIPKENKEAEKLEVICTFKKTGKGEYKRIKHYNLSKCDKAVANLVLETTILIYIVGRLKLSVSNSVFGKDYHP